MQDGICSVSFGDPAIMTLTHAREEPLPPGLAEQVPLGHPDEQQVGALGPTEHVREDPLSRGLAE